MKDGSSLVSRNVYFFRIAHFSEVAAKLEQAVRLIGSLPFNDQGRYLPTTTGDVVHSVFVDADTYPIRIQLAKIRRSDLPLIEEGGKITALNISRSAGIMDWSHIIIYEDGYAVAEFNRDAPRISALGEYLVFKSSGIIKEAVRFNPLFQRSVLDQLSDFKYVSRLEVEAPTTEAEAIAKGDKHIGAALAACAKINQVRTASFTLKTAVNPKLDLKKIAYNLFTNSLSREGLTKLRVSGRRNLTTKPLDLLQEYLIKTEQFMKIDSRSRAIDSNHAFSILESTYKKEKYSLRNAASIDISK